MRWNALPSAPFPFYLWCYIQTLSAPTLPSSGTNTAAVSKDLVPYTILASESFLQNQVLVRQLEKEQHLYLEEVQLPDGEDLILDYKSCCLVFSSKDIPCSSPDDEQELIDKILVFISLYERIWIILQIDPHVDKYVPDERDSREDKRRSVANFIKGTIVHPFNIYTSFRASQPKWPYYLVFQSSTQQRWFGRYPFNQLSVILTFITYPIVDFKHICDRSASTSAEEGVCLFHGSCSDVLLTQELVIWAVA